MSPDTLMVTCLCPTCAAIRLYRCSPEPSASIARCPWRERFFFPSRNQQRVTAPLPPRSTIDVLAPLQVPKTLVNILSNCDSMSVLIWASAAGWMASLLLVCGQGILTLPEAMDTWMEGMKVR